MPLPALLSNVPKMLAAGGGPRDRRGLYPARIYARSRLEFQAPYVASPAATRRANQRSMHGLVADSSLL
jgi:hypothetical protein